MVEGPEQTMWAVWEEQRTECLGFPPQVVVTTHLFALKPGTARRNAWDFNSSQTVRLNHCEEV